MITAKLTMADIDIVSVHGMPWYLYGFQMSVESIILVCFPLASIRSLTGWQHSHYLSKIKPKNKQKQTKQKKQNES